MNRLVVGDSGKVISKICIIIIKKSGEHLFCLVFKS